MNDTSDTHSAYSDAIHEADKILDDALNALRADQEAHRIGPAEAAATRIGLLERHLAECQRLRREMLGGS